MSVRNVISLLCGALLVGFGTVLAGADALAETIVVNDQVTVRDSNIARPKRGMRMTQVEQKFGAPATRHPAVGLPPITRWDYPDFSVFFEHDIVLHSVVPGDHAAPAGDDHAASAADDHAAPAADEHAAPAGDEHAAPPAGDDHAAPAGDDHSTAGNDHPGATDDHAQSAPDDHPAK